MTVLYVVLLAIATLLLVLVVRALWFPSLQPNPRPADIPGPNPKSLQRLSGAIAIPTISRGVDLPVDEEAFLAYHRYLEAQYPLIHSHLKKEVFSRLSLLYTWEGSDPELKPMVLLAHTDVVPADHPEEWEQPPFSGAVDKTHIWGRGTLDMKGLQISILEAVEQLLSEGHRPRRSIYLALGHDEEVSGKNGAAVMAAALMERGVQAEFVMDEGLAITKKVVPLVKCPVALIGTAEKGYLSVKISAETKGGHSSAPEEDTAIILLNRALSRVADKPMKARITTPLRDFIRHTGPEMRFWGRLMFANQWLFDRLIIRVLDSQRGGSAAVRTTCVPAMIRGGVKDNVIPSKAEAVLNLRIMPEETTGEAIAHIKKVIADERIQVTPVGQVSEPPPVSAVDVPAYRMIARTIREVYPEVIVSPLLVYGQTDSRYFTQVAENNYQFAPNYVSAEDLKGIHGNNEKIRIDHFFRGIGFYHRLIKNADRI